MTKNLETADMVVKLILAISVVIFYFMHVISGPLAQVMMILALIVLAIFVTKLILHAFLRD